MKTTIDINDALLRRAKRLAAKRNQTLKAILESALLEFVDESGRVGRPRFKLRKHTFRGQGLMPGLDEHDWAAIRERLYEGLGG
jgi:hypothetical protein